MGIGFEIVAGTDLGANGAFSQQTNTIYLSREFLEQNAENLAVIASVLLEDHAANAK